MTSPEPAPAPAPDGRQRIIGIDPGTRHVGYGVVELSAGQLRRVAGGALAARHGEVAERLAALHRELCAVIREYAPTAAAVETVFVGDNVRTAITIGEARGMVLVAAAGAGLTVTGYPPALVKRAVAGSGRADKDQMREMIRTLLRLEEMPATDHEADALALAVTHALRQRESYRRELPEAVRRQLADAGERTLPEAVRRQLGRQNAAPLPGGKIVSQRRGRKR